jgi:hypothetical protein
MSTSEKKPTLTVVAGRDGPTEGPYSNAAKITAVRAGISKKKEVLPTKTQMDEAKPDRRSLRGNPLREKEGGLAARLAHRGGGSAARRR